LDLTEHAVNAQDMVEDIVEKYERHIELLFVEDTEPAFRFELTRERLLTLSLVLADNALSLRRLDERLVEHAVNAQDMVEDIVEKYERHIELLFVEDTEPCFGTSGVGQTS
jgi:DNA-binding ferritin-like protein